MHSIYKILQPSVGKIPILICSLSYKMHSIYMLRMFNDSVAMLFMNLCILLAIQNKWKGSILLYSIALSIKMNILLYLPGLLLVVNWGKNYRYTLSALVFIVCFQLIIAAPFLLTNPSGYFTMAFDFSRVFLFEQSAYWQFLPEEIFVSRRFHNTLLLLHVLSLLIFLFRKAVVGRSIKAWAASLNLPCSLSAFMHPSQGLKLEPDSNLHLVIAYAMFTTNFIGIFFARSFHIQYYSWYMFSVPFILCYKSRSLLKYSLFLLLEIGYKQHPPKIYSSCIILFLHICFLLILDRAADKITPATYLQQAKSIENAPQDKKNT